MYTARIVNAIRSAARPALRRQFQTYTKKPNPLHLERPKLPPNNFTVRHKLSCLYEKITTQFINLNDLSSDRRSMIFRSLNQMLANAFKHPPSIESYFEYPQTSAKLEVAFDTNKMAPVGMMIHRFDYSDDIANTPVIFYHPKIWALSSSSKSTLDARSYTGLGIMPALMTRFAYYLQLTNPGLPCYMGIPVYSPWVLKMLSDRYTDFTPKLSLTSTGINYYEPNSDERRLLTEMMQKLEPRADPALRSYAFDYPLIPLNERTVETSNFKGSHFSDGDSVASIIDERAFSQAFLRTKAPRLEEAVYCTETESFMQNGLLAAVPCSAENLEAFLSSWTRSTTDYKRIFETAVPPEDLLSSMANRYHPFLTDLENLYHFDTGHTDQEKKPLKSTEDFRRIITAEHLDFKKSGRTTPIHSPEERLTKVKFRLANKLRRPDDIPPEQRITSFDERPVTLSGNLPDTEFSIEKPCGKSETLTSRIYRALNIPNSSLPFILDEIHPILTANFYGGDFLSREQFLKRFKRRHTYIELFFNSANRIVGFLFHEPFKVEAKTAQLEKERPNEHLKLIVLKTGLGCLEESYQKYNIIPFFLRRFYIRLQAQYEHIPCYNYFLASSRTIFKSEYGIAAEEEETSELFLGGFYPMPRQYEAGALDPSATPERPPSAAESELIRLIFCAELLLKLNQGGDTLAGLMKYAASLPITIPYPILPGRPKTDTKDEKLDKQYNEDFMRKLDERILASGQTDDKELRKLVEEYWIDRMYYRADSQQTDFAGIMDLNRTAPVVRCLSRLTNNRVKAYANTDYKLTLLNPAENENMLIDGVRKLCNTASSQKNLNNLAEVIPTDREKAYRTDKRKRFK